MTLSDSDAYCEDMDPENLAEVNTAKDPSSVGKWENRSDNNFKEGIINVEDLCEDMEPWNLVTNEDAKYPTTIDKDMDESDGDIKEVNNMYSWRPRTYRYLDPWHRLGNRDTFLKGDLCEDMKPGNLVTNEVVKDPTTIDKDMDESDGDMGEDFNMYSWRPRTYTYLDLDWIWQRPLSFNFPGFSYLQREKARLKQEEVIKMALQRQKARLKQKELIKMKARLKQKELIQMKARLKQKELIKMKEEVTKIRQEIKENLVTIQLPCDSTSFMYKEVVKMKQEVIKILQEGITNLLEVIEEMMQENFGMKERKNLFKVILTLLAYIVLLSSILSKSALQKQLRFKYSFGKAALLLLWTSGDVEKHPGPPLNDMKTIRELVTRLVKEVQGKKVVDWATAPPSWDKNVVSFQDINKLKDSDNEEKYAMFYEALYACIKMFGHVPDWCVVEMTYVETGNAPELHKCQTARKIRELLEHESPADREDILGMAGYPRQGESVPAQAVKTANRHQQSRQRKCPFNVPGYRPISAIKESDTARKIAEGCIAQSKNAGKCQSGNHQTMTKKRSATTTTTQPASKQPRTSAANTSTQPATSTIVRPNTASAATSIATSTQPALIVSLDSQSAAPTIVTTSTAVANNTGASLQIAQNLVVASSNVSQIGRSGQPTTQLAQNTGPARTNNGFGLINLICAQPVASATASSKRLPATSTIVRPTTSTDSAVATACYTGSHSSTFCTSRASNNISTWTLPSTAQVSQHLNHDGQQSNDTSTGTQPNAAKVRQQPNRGGQPSNLISLPSDDLGDLGFSSNVDLEQFIKQIMKGGKM